MSKSKYKYSESGIEFYFDKKSKRYRHSHHNDVCLFIINSEIDLGENFLRFQHIKKNSNIFFIEEAREVSSISYIEKQSIDFFGNLDLITKNLKSNSNYKIGCCVNNKNPYDLSYDNEHSKIAYTSEFSVELFNELKLFGDDFLISKNINTSAKLLLFLSGLEYTEDILNLGETKRFPCIGEQSSWPTLDHFFRAMNIAFDWVLLRNYENLEGLDTENDDIDILVRNTSNFNILTKAIKRENFGRCSWAVNINKINIFLDVRFIGDKYFDPAWANSMLLNKEAIASNLWVLNNEDYFYSLIYHAFLQKKNVKEVYLKRFTIIAENMHVAELKKDKVSLMDYLEILNNFLDRNGFHYTHTLDAYANLPNINLIRRKEIVDQDLKSFNSLSSKIKRYFSRKMGAS